MPCDEYEIISEFLKFVDSGKSHEKTTWLCNVKDELYYNVEFVTSYSKVHPLELKHLVEKFVKNRRGK